MKGAQTKEREKLCLNFKHKRRTNHCLLWRQHIGCDSFWNYVLYFN